MTLYRFIFFFYNLDSCVFVRYDWGQRNSWSKLKKRDSDFLYLTAECKNSCPYKYRRRKKIDSKSFAKIMMYVNDSAFC